MASITFVNAYSVDTALSPAGKEQNDIYFFDASLGSAFISDGTSGLNFSGNDVSAVGLNIGGHSYYGWISRPIKSGGVVRGFYFWSDAQFTTLALAQADGNTDGDGNPYDNIGFVLVVDQAWFDSISEFSSGIKNVGSSSDRVDTALNLLIANHNPVAVADTATAVEAGGVSNGTAGSDATGNALTNDTDSDSGDTHTVTGIGTTSASSSVAASTTSTNGTQVTGTYGTLTIGSDGTFKYVVDNSNTTVEALRTSANTLTETFTYTMSDSHNATSTSTITVTVQGQNDAPTAINDYNVAKEATTTAGSGFTSAGATATGNVLTNDTDKDSGDGKTVGGLAGSVTTNGTVTVNGTYKFYIPGGAASTFNPVAVGDEAWIVISGTAYALYADAAGTTKINVTSTWDSTNFLFSLNAQPLYYYDSVSSSIKSVSNLSGGTLNGTTIGFKNDSTGTATSTTTSSMKSGTIDATNGVQSVITGSTVSVSSLSIDGSIAVGMGVSGTGVPAGTLISGLTYDGSGNVATITFDHALTSANGTTINFSGSAGGTYTGHYGTLVLNANGTYTYTPNTDIASLNSGQSGIDNFKYTMQDTAGATSTATLSITVYGSGSSDPVAVADTASATETGTSAGSNPSGNVLTNDTGTGRIVSGAHSSSISTETAIAATNTTVTGQYGTLTIKQDGTWSYALDNTNSTVNALNVGGTLSDVFLYRDTNSPTSSGSSVATLTITINGANDGPVAANESATAIEKSGANNSVAGFSPAGNVLSNDTDVDSPSLTVTSVRTGNVEGSGTAGTLGAALVGAHGSLTLNANGTWTYAVNENDSAVNALAAGQSLTDTFNYTVSDGSATDTAVITVTINGAADTVTVNDIFVNEASPYAMFQVTGLAGMPVTLALGNSAGLTIPPDQPVTLGTDLSNTIQYYDGSAWQTYSSSATIPAGGTLLVRIAINNDNTYEGSEAFTLNVTTSDGSFTRAIGTINDEGTGDTFNGSNTTGTSDGTGTDDDRPTVSIGDVTVTEGGIAQFTVSLDHASTEAIHFTPSVASGTATIGTDTADSTSLQYYDGSAWVAVSGPVTIAAGATSIQLRIATSDDSIAENSETFTVTTGYIADAVKNQDGATATATITDNDTAGFTIGSVSGNTTEAGGTATFTVKLTSQPTANVVVTLASDDGSEGTVTTGGTLTFTSANWDTAQQVVVTGVDDHLDDGDVAYHVNLSAASGDSFYSGLTGQASITNTDDDGPPSISIGNVSVAESAGTATFTVTRTGASDDVVTVDYATQDTTATAGADYTATNGTLTFAAGETSKTVVVSISEDSIAEGSETFKVHLSNVNDTLSGGESIGTADGVGTITDNDTAGYTITAISGNTTEAGGTATFTVKLTSQPTADVVITLASDDGSEGQVTTGATLTFTSSNWNTAQQVVVTGQDDTLDDGDIAYHVNLTGASSDANYDNRTGQVSVTNVDNDGPPTVSIGDVTVGEGAGTATFTVTRTGATGDTTTVDYATADGTGTAGSDYTAASGTLTFAAGETTKDVVVNISDDHLVESSETFTVTLSNVHDGTSAAPAIGTATGTGTITDNDTAGLGIGSISGNTTEAGGTATFTIQLTSQPTSNVVVTLDTDDHGEGLVTSTTTLTFDSSNWNTAQVVTVTGQDDTLDDGDIGCHVTVSTTSPDSHYDNLTGSVAVTNADNDGPPVVSIGDVTVNEGDGFATFTVTRSGATGGTTTVDYATQDDTATAGSDYTATSGHLTFAAGETSKTVVVAVTDDAAAEGSETFKVVLSNVSDATSPSESIGTDTGTGTIIDNDSAVAPGFVIGAVSGDTTEAGGTATFTVKLTKAPTAQVVISVGSDDTTEGTIFSGTSLTFDSSNWNTTQTVVVKGVDDSVDDGDIAYHATLSASSSGDAGFDGLHTTVGVTNTDDDSPPLVSIGDISVNEADGTATFTVTRSGATGDTTTVDYTTQDGTATAGSDYTAASGTVTFGVGETSKTVTVSINDDHLHESSETFDLVLSNVHDGTSTAASINPSTGTATIADNDTAGFSIGAISGNTTEAGGTASFTVQLTSQPTADVVITMTSDDTTEGTAATTLTFTSANWNVAQTVTVTGVDDHLDDGDIGYHVNLSAASSDGNYDTMTGQVNVTNTDDDGPPVVSIGDVTVSEAAGHATFTVTRTGASDDVVTVDYTTQDGTAAAGSDYTATNGTLTFAAGETSKTVVVDITDDTQAESSETFKVHLSNVSDTLSGSESIGTADGTGTITDNDSAGFTIGAISGDTTEAGGTASFTVKLNSQPTADVVVTVSSDDTTEGTAATTLTFNSTNWNVAQTVTVTGVDDHIDDGDIGYHVNLTAASSDGNYDTMTGQVNVTNTDDDGPPVISIGDVTVGESAGQATFTVTRTGASDDVVTVDYATQDGTATAGSDYTATNGTLTFAAGETSKTVVVAITDDSVDESNETFTVNLSNVADAISGNESVGTADGTGTITDDDTAGIVVGALSGHTTEAGGTATFTVSLSSEPTADVVITAVSGDTSEGTAAPVHLTFTSANWNTPQDVVVTGVDDHLDDGDIAYQVNMAANSTDTRYDALTAHANVTNDDDDGPPVISVGDISVNEGDGTATFTVTRTGASDDVVTVDVATVDGTATGGSDYTSGTGTLTFLAGQTSKTVIVGITDDSLVEGDETFKVHLSNVADATSDNESIGTADGTATIVDNDSAGFDIGAISGDTTEAGGTASFTVKLTTQPTADVVITVTSDDTSEGTAATTLTFTSANWNVAQAVTVTGVDDHLDDGDIAYHVNLSAASSDGVYDTMTGQVNVTNTDNDGPPVISVGDVSVNEGDGTATFTVTRTGASDDVVTVDYATQDGTATGGSDYTAATGTLTFAAGETSKTVVVSITDDSSVESSETFKLHLSNVNDTLSGGEAIGTADGTGTIADNDSAGFNIGAVSGDTTEAGGTASFTVKLTTQPSADVVITVSSDDTSEGTAATTLTFNSSNWNVAQTVTVTGVDDHLDDGDVGYHVNLSASSSDGNYDTMTGQVNVTNTDNDGPPVISVGDVSVNEGDGTATFTVTRTGASDDVVTVDYATQDGTATGGSDYTAAAGTLTFAAGETSKTVVVSITDDSSVESSETFKLHLSNVNDTLSGGESIGTADGTGTIADNDAAGFTIGAISGNTTEAGGTASFTVKLTTQPTANVVITVASDDTTEGTAATTLTFTSANWNIAQTVTVTGVDDHLDDGDIAYHVNLSAASSDGNYDAMTGQVNVTNVDNDGPPVISVGNASVNEADGTATFTVTRSGASDDVVTVDYATQDGTATAGSDYTATNGTLTFAVGETSKTVVVSITDDHLVEASETFKVHLSNVADAVSSNESIGTADGTGTIADNDTAGFTISAISGDTTEAGGTASFTIQLTSQPTSDVVITFASDDGSEGTVTAGATLTFNSSNWNTAQQVVVTGADDQLDDGDIGYHVTVNTASSDADYDGRTASVSVSNLDNDGPPVVSIGNASINEAAGTATFTVTRTGASGDTVTVDFATQDGTAAAGSDYTATNGTLTFAAGETSKTVVVSITDDNVVESSETFKVHLSNVSDAVSSNESIGTADGTGTIADNDSAGFSIGAISGNTTEAGGTASFTVQLTSQPTADVVITVSSDDTTEGTAATALTFTSANWNVAQTVTVTGVDDHLDDGDIAYHVNLSATSSDIDYDTMTGQVNVTNVDNDGPPVVSVGDVSVNEGDGTATFTVTRTGASDDVVTVDYATQDGTAAAGSDFTGTTGTLTFAAGETSKTVVVSITDDSSVESSETFKLHLSNVNDTLSGGESIGTADGTGTIADNDSAGFTIGAISGNTTEAGGTASFTVQLTSQPSGDVVITVSSDDTSEGTAATTLTFNSSNWNVAQTVTVTGVDDHLDDGDVGYHVNLSAASSDANYDTMTSQVNVTNTDDDGPPVISIGNASVNEADGTATFTVTRSGASDDVVTVDYATQDGTATGGSDYTAAAGTLTFAAGETSKTVIVSVADDHLVESSEDFKVHLSNVNDTLSGSESIGTADGTGTIADNDSAGFNISAISGNTTEAGGTATFTIQLTSQPTADVVITFASDDTTEGTVTAGATLTFNSSNWNTAQQVVVTGADDSIDDGDIGYHVNVSSSSGDANYDGNTASVSVTNTDDDGPPVVSIGNVTVSESDGAATFTVTRSGALGGTTTVDYATADGTATSTQDYTAATGTVTFAAGETSKTIVVSVTDDHSVESDETFTVHLSNVQDATSASESIGTGTGTATINDNDSAGFVIGPVSGNTTEAGGTASFTVKLTSQPAGDVVVTVTSDDTTEGSVNTTLTFDSSNWNTAQVVTVTGVDDSIDDGDIGYTVHIAAASSDGDYDGKTTSASLTNTDNDGPPVVSIGNATVGEADGLATFTVTRSGATGGVTTVDWATSDGTATAGQDYTAASGTVTFAAGETSKTVTVAITDDHLVESSEGFSVTLSNVQDATSPAESIGQANGTATIADNDSAGFTIGAISGNTTEAGGTASFTVQLTSQPTADVVITVTSDDTTEGTAATTLTFTSANWNVARTVTVTGVDDHLDDGDIGYHVNLSAASSDGNYDTMTGQVNVTNTDDDGPPVISVGDVSVNEGDGTATFTVTRTGASDDAVTVDYATADGTATAGSDYTAATGTLTFAAGETSKTIVVSITDDHSVESAETFTVALSNVNDTLSGSESIGTGTGTATIADNDSAGFTIGAISGNTTEAGGTASFTVKLDSQPASDVVITVTSDDTTEGTVNTTLTFDSSNWNVAQTVTVTGVDDHLDDGDVGYHVNLSAASSDANYDAMTGQVDVTNTDDDGPPVISIGNVAVNEADGTATFTVTRSGASDDVVTVDYATQDGTAAAGSDYTAASGTLTFAAGETSKTVVVNVTDDSLVESAESFKVHLSNVNDTLSGGESIASADGTATIADNDSAGFTIGAISGNTTEAGGAASFTIQLTSQPTGDVVITFASDDTSEGIVTTGATLTFNASNWNTAQTVVVTGADDQLDDGDIAYHVGITTASSDANYDGRTASVAVTNDDNDGPPVVSIGNVTVSEGGGAATFTVTRSGASDDVVTVDYATADGTAAAASDYTAASGTVTFNAGETTKTIIVAITDDNIVESDETFTVALSNVQDALSPAESIGTATGTGTITNNDALGVTVTGSPDVSEGATAVFTVNLTKPSDSTTEVTLTLGSGADAADASDYSSTLVAYYFDGGNNKIALAITGGKVVLPAFQTQFFVAVATTQDSVYEGQEGFTLAASVPGGASASDQSVIVDDGTGVTYDDKGNPLGGGQDDDRPVLTVVGSPDVSEGSHAVFTVMLSHATAADAPIDLALGAAGDSASASDYAQSFTAYYIDGSGNVQALAVSSGGSVLLPAGVTRFYVSVDTIDDSVFEGRETFTLSANSAIARQGGAGAASIIDDGTGKFYDDRGNPIAGGTPDDDQAHIIVTGAPDVSEGSTAVFSVQFSAASVAPTEVALQLGNAADSAEANDYSASPVAYYFDANGVQQSLAITSGKVVVPAGVTQFFVAVATTQDTVYEGRETFTLAAAITGGASDSGTAGIVDDGSGQVYDAHGTPTGLPGNDDRPTVTVDALPDVSEGSNAIYTVHLSNPSDGPLDIVIATGAPGDTTSPNDYSANETAYYLDADGVRHDLPIVDGHLQLPPGVTTFYVDVPTVQDSPRVLEGHETLTLDVAVSDGASGSGTATVVDDGTGHVYDDYGNVTAAPGDNDSPIGADLDPSSDDGVSDTDHITSVIDPYFTIDAGNLLSPGDTVQLVTPGGEIAGSSVVTPADAANGTVDVQSWQLDDGTYEFTARVIDPDGNVVGEGPVHVTIVTDRDGVQPSVELAANGGDFNQDGIADWKQNNVAQLPITSVSDFLAGTAAPASSFGAIIAGDVHQAAPGAAVSLDPTAQLLDLSIGDTPAPLPSNMVQASALFNFSVTAQDGESSLHDMDPTRPGLQTRVVIELPQGVDATGYVKWDSATHTWFSYMDDGNLDTYDDGATLLDLNGDGLVDRVVVTLTDGGIGDDDHAVNGMITDPGMLVLAAAAPAPAATPVFDVKLANGDHYYTTNAGEAAHMAQGTGNVFVGAAFDSLGAAEGGHAILANYNPFTTDWYFAASGAAMPYVCYEAMPGAGFGAANAGQGIGTDYHLFMDVHGQTQLVTLAQGAALGPGFVDKGAVFATTNNSAFTFDVDGYLVANAGNQAIRDLVHTLSQQYAHTSDAGFVEAVEQDYLARVQLTGIAHGGAAGAADVNAAFGTTFSA